MTAGLGAMELLLFVFMSAAGQPADLASMLSPQDYFKTRGIEISIDKMVELSARDPGDGAAQLAQLLALRILGEDETFKKSSNFASQRRVLEEIAAGRKAQDKLGFAKEYAQRTLAQIDGRQLPVEGPARQREDGLAWFPPSAIFVVGIENRPGPKAASLKSVVVEVLKTMPAEIKKEFYKGLDAVGNVQIQRVTAAFVDEGEHKGRSFIRLTGRVQHGWMRDFLKTTGGLEAREHNDPQGAAITLFTAPRGGPALALIGDHDVLVASFIHAGKDEEVIDQALALRARKQANAATGPLKPALDKVPAKAAIFLVGEFPQDFRNEVGRPFGAFPKKVAAHATRTATGFDLLIEGGMEDEDQARTFIKAVSKLRMDALEALQKAPAIPVPGINLVVLIDVLNSLQFEARGAEVHLRMLLSDSALQILPMWFMARTVKN